MALTPTETAILDMLDDGLTEREIAQRGFVRATVARAIRTFGSERRNTAADARAKRKMRRGSAQLLAALQSATDN